MSGDDESLRWERRARELLQRLAAIVATATSARPALRAFLDEICAHTGWPVGHALTADGAGVLSSTALWHLEDAQRYRRFREVSETLSFAPHVGLPGRAYASGRPTWIIDVTQDPSFPRNALVADLQVRAAFAVPAVAHGRVLAVLEFFSPVAREPDAPLLAVLACAGVLLGSVIDRGAAEEALRRSELRFRAVVETANDGIISIDSGGRVVSWNDGARAIFGWTEEEMLGCPLAAIMPKRFRAAHEAGILRVGSGGPHHVIGRTVELAGVRRDGSELPIELSLASSRLGDDTFFTGIIRDISRRKADEAELQGFAARLAESERKANEASRAKSSFLANMSHELRTPLNAILGFVQLLRRDRELAADQQDSLQIILSSGEHLLALINDVLSIAKIEAGHVVVASDDFDLARLIDSVREMFLPRARAKQLTLVVEAIDLPNAHGDEAKLRQVLINLVGNAIKFTASGGVALRAQWVDGVASFEVEDTGRGIAEGDLEKIFEPFVQGRAGAAGDGAEGTGLGLAISKSFVRAMGGELEVRSASARGSCFSFAVPLPRTASASRVAPERRVLGLLPGQPERLILVVDNDVDNRRLLERLLGGLGFRVMVAADGAAGLATALEFRPDLVLMDMRMPVLDGYEATRQLRAREAPGTHTVVIALTASAFDHDRPAIFAAGCDEIIAKPFREATLFEAIARTLAVEYLYADEPPSEHDTTDETVLAPAQLAALPPALLEALRAALVSGDDLAAQRACESIAALSPEAGHELLRRVRSLELDALIGLIERIPS